MSGKIKRKTQASINAELELAQEAAKIVEETNIESVRLKVTEHYKKISSLFENADPRIKNQLFYSKKKIEDFKNHCDFYDPYTHVSGNKPELAFVNAWRAYCSLPEISLNFNKYKKEFLTKDCVSDLDVPKKIMKDYQSAKAPLILLSSVNELRNSIENDLGEIRNDLDMDIDTISKIMNKIKSNCIKLKAMAPSLEDLKLKELSPYKKEIEEVLQRAFFSEEEQKRIIELLTTCNKEYQSIPKENMQSVIYAEAKEVFLEVRGYLLDNHMKDQLDEVIDMYTSEMDRIRDEELLLESKRKASIESAEYKLLIDETNGRIENLPQFIRDTENVIPALDTILRDIYFKFIDSKKRLHSSEVPKASQNQINAMLNIKDTILTWLHKINPIYKIIPSEFHEKEDLREAFRAFMINEISYGEDTEVEERYRQVFSKYAESSKNTKDNNLGITFSSFKKLMHGETPYHELTDSERKKRKLYSTPGSDRKTPSSSSQKKGSRLTFEELLSPATPGSTPKTPFTPTDTQETISKKDNSPVVSKVTLKGGAVSSVSVDTHASNRAEQSAPNLQSSISTVSSQQPSPTTTNTAFSSILNSNDEPLATKTQIQLENTITTAAPTITATDITTSPTDISAPAATTKEADAIVDASKEPYIKQSLIPLNAVENKNKESSSSSTLNSNDEPLTPKTQIQPENTITTTTPTIRATNITTSSTNTSAPAATTKEADAVVDAWKEPYIKQSQILLTAVKNKENKYKESLILLNEYISKAKLSAEVKKKVEELMRAVSKMDSTFHTVSSKILLSTLGLLFDPKNKAQVDAYNQLGKQLIKDKPNSTAAKAVFAAMLALGALVLTLGILICVGTLGAGITAGSATTTAGAVLLVTGGLGLFSARNGATKKEHLEQISGNMDELRVLAPRG